MSNRIREFSFLFFYASFLIIWNVYHCECEDKIRWNLQLTILNIVLYLITIIRSITPIIFAQRWMHNNLWWNLYGTNERFPFASIPGAIIRKIVYIGNERRKIYERWTDVDSSFTDNESVWIQLEFMHSHGRFVFKFILTNTRFNAKGKFTQNNVPWTNEVNSFRSSSQTNVWIFSFATLVYWLKLIRSIDCIANVQCAVMRRYQSAIPSNNTTTKISHKQFIGCFFFAVRDLFMYDNPFAIVFPTVIRHIHFVYAVKRYWI